MTTTGKAPSGAVRAEGATKAVEALRHIEQYSAGQHGITAVKALHAIGPLPDLPSNGEGPP